MSDAEGRNGKGTGREGDGTGRGYVPSSHMVREWVRGTAH